MKTEKYLFMRFLLTAIWRVYFHPAKFDNFKDEKISGYKTVSVAQSKNLQDWKPVSLTNYELRNKYGPSHNLLFIDFEIGQKIDFSYFPLFKGHSAIFGEMIGSSMYVMSFGLWSWKFKGRK